MSDSSPQDDIRRLVGGVRTWVERQAENGLDAFPRSPLPPSESACGARPEGDGKPEDPAAALAAVREELGDCHRCNLCARRTQIVFGVGDPRSEVLFVGEGPGEEEDLRGEPFVGRAGQLLTEIITKGMGLQRNEVYIANVVKCRPPNNRNPQLDEIAACEPFLVGQIEAIRPRVIVALGKFAAQTLLTTQTPIGKLRGRWHDYRGIKLMPTFHPSYLLRNPADKRLVWEDIQLVLRELGLPVPAASRSRSLPVTRR